MRVLVTGGAGFIGSHVVDQLLAQGVDVRVLDLLDPAVHPAAPTAGALARECDRHRDLDLDLRAELVCGSVHDPDVVRRAVDGVDAVCHQAAKVGLGVDFGDAAAYVHTNDMGTAVLLEGLWRRSFRGRFVLASSMVVYGEGRARCGEHGPVTPLPRRANDLAAGIWEPRCPGLRCRSPLSWMAMDEHTAPAPRNIYAATKLHQEHLCQLWGNETAATVVALRYHNVYGPRMPRDTPYAGVASIFRSQVAAGRAAQVFEDGAQTRDFVHVRDVARANVIALLGPDVEPGAYNIASGAPRTIADMATALADAFPGAAAPQVTGRWRLGDVRHVVASPGKAAERLGFRAEISFEEGMAEFAHARQRAAAGG